MKSLIKVAAALLIASSLSPLGAAAQEHCSPARTDASPPIVNFRIDNDLFGNGGQDQGYTNGAVITLVSPDLVDYTDDPCLPALVRWLNTWMEHGAASTPDQKNMVFSIGQSLYTPTDWSRRDLDREDRPYAAMLMSSFGYNIRRGNSLHTTQLQLGVVGPLAFGEEVQDAVHDAISEEKFSGWGHQLHNEPLVGLVHERMRKSTYEFANVDSRLQFDVISHWGGSIGNAFTHANAGAELRIGWNLPDDFGSSPLRPAGENTAPKGAPRSRKLSGHAFLTSDARWVIRDITLDGNTFESSHSVNKRSFVGEVGYGLVLTYHKWKFAVARYFRSREFDSQVETPRFGSFTISRDL